MKKLLSPEEHGVLFALIAKNLEEAVPKYGIGTIRAATRRYGVERGGRMAQRVIKNGDKLNGVHYICYGEWRPSDYPTQKTELKDTHPYTICTKSCSWYLAWEKYGLLEWGKLYCLDIDESLSLGYNPEHPLKVNAILSHGAECCNFQFPTINMDKKTKDYIEKKQEELGTGIIEDFNYHTAHLYYTFKDEIYLRLGEKGINAVNNALMDFEEIFGKEAVEIIFKYKNEDFIIAR